MVTPLVSFGALTGCGVWETDGRRSLHGLGTFRRNLGGGEAAGIGLAIFLWVDCCLLTGFQLVYQVVTPTLKNQLSMLVFLKPVTPGCLPLNHSAFLKLYGCACIRTRLGGTLIQQTALNLWYIYHTYFEYNGSKAIIAIVGYAKSSQLSYYSPILSHNNYHHHSPT